MTSVGVCVYAQLYVCTQNHTHSLTHAHIICIHTCHIRIHACTHVTYSMLLTKASEPKITDFQPELHATAGEQVTLRVNFTGIPKPTITWIFKGTKMEGDYATELGTDG